MSRYVDHSDDDSPEAILAYGRWQHNARAALKGKRGRKALAELREALLALPEHRLIDGALCTVGGPARVPDVAEDAIAERIAQRAAWAAEHGYEFTERDSGEVGRWMQMDVEQEREGISAATERQGEGVCAVGAYLWHQKVRAGMEPGEAFASLPSVAVEDDSMGETAGLGQQAGLVYTLAWELAYRNDETFGRMTPEERWQAFVDWIDRELVESASAA